MLPSLVKRDSKSILVIAEKPNVLKKLTSLGELKKVVENNECCVCASAAELSVISPNLSRAWIGSRKMTAFGRRKSFQNNASRIALRAIVGKKASRTTRRELLSEQREERSKISRQKHDFSYFWNNNTPMEHQKGRKRLNPDPNQSPSVRFILFWRSMLIQGHFSYAESVLQNQH